MKQGQVLRLLDEQFFGRLSVFSAAIRTFSLIWIISSYPALAGELGANKVDLFSQYLPSSAIIQNADADRYIRRLMAKKAIADAQDVGLKFLRVSVTGYWPINFGDLRNDLAPWQTDPDTFWGAMHEMFDDLDQSGIRLVPTFVWNRSQFAVLGKDTVTTFIRNPRSPSRLLLAQFVEEFIKRYRARNTILFYELTNELNLDADMDLSKACKNSSSPCVFSGFTTADMITFSRDLVRQFKTLDPSRSISSGYAIPRPAAAHLSRQPAFAKGGPDWTADTPLEFRQNLLAIHEPFDVISVHIYPGAENSRFGRPQGREYELVGDAASAARIVSKPLFVGEFGEYFTPTPFTIGLLNQLVYHEVNYAAIWSWEFYQFNTYQTHNTPATHSSVEPGYSDELIELLVTEQRALGGEVVTAPDGAAPRVILTWPLPCAMLHKAVDLFAVASHGGKTVQSVDFFVDGILIARDFTSPYSVRFDPAGLGERTAEIKVKANTTVGSSAEFKSTIKLNGDKPACTPPTR